jgi:hypothetical protein
MDSFSEESRSYQCRGIELTHATQAISTVLHTQHQKFVRIVEGRG